MAARNFPDRIGKYRVVGVVGHGGMGDVLKALQEPLNRVVALKVLSEEHSRNEEFQERFVMEAKAVSLLEHQNIVGIYDFGVDASYRYIAMRFIEGENLADRLRREKRFEPRIAVDFAKKICRALKYAHERRILHRDIKPQNILLGEKDTLFVTDFGIARLFQETRVTRTGVVVGTPEYMSPEQAEGLELSGQTDLYSLGVVLYEMVIGAPPFTGETPLAIAYQHVNVQPIPLSKLWPEAPKRLELVVLKALKKDRAARYKTADEFLDDLDTVFDTTSEANKTRDMKAVDEVVRERLFDNDLRVVDRRSADRRREGRRAYARRVGAVISPWRWWIYAGLAVLVCGIGYDRWQRATAIAPSVVTPTLPIPYIFSGAGRPELAFDGDLQTPWDARADGGVFTMTLHPLRPANRVEMISGGPGRPKRMVFTFNGVKEFEVELKNTGDRQVFELPEVLQISEVKVVVLSSFSQFPGEKVQISEIKFWNSENP